MAGARTILSAALVVAWPVLFCVQATSADAQASGLEVAQHVGVASCAGSHCHGAAAAPANSPILQNEYLTWQRQDAHANAYRVLTTPAAQRIAANLGYRNPTEARECLGCHTDFVPPGQRGPRFQIAEGVGCEACHGGAQNWLDSHSSGKTHAQNVAAGLVPLEDPVQRARLCLGCHIGSTEKPMTHQMMSAGHKPLDDFELDFRTAFEPAHFRVSKSYRERKTYQPDGKIWAAGQLIASMAFLDGINSSQFQQRGDFPELAFFDCGVCHRAPNSFSTGDDKSSGPSIPGNARLAEGYLLMTGNIAMLLDPSIGKQWNQELIALHLASQKSVTETKQVAARLSRIAGSLLPALQNRQLSRKDLLTLMQASCQIGLERNSSYGTAKQIYYSIDALRINLQQELNTSSKSLNTAVDQLFSVVAAETNYTPAKLKTASLKIREAILALN